MDSFQLLVLSKGFDNQFYPFIFWQEPLQNVHAGEDIDFEHLCL